MKKRNLYYMGGVLLVVLLLWPVTVSCQIAGKPCNEMSQGMVFYDTQPFGVSLVEMLTGSDLPIKYGKTWRHNSFAE